MSNVENFLTHYGVKGMKWGVRKDTSRTNRVSARQKKKEKKTLAKAQKKWDANVNKNWHVAYNKAVDHANKVLIPQINKEYKDKYGDYSKFTEQQKQAMDNDYAQRFDALYQQEFDKMFGKRPGSR